MNVVFITVDPERDTVEAMAEYVGYFHPSIRGWTGPEEEIARAAQGFRARYGRVPTEGGDYTMNHTASVFLFDAERPVQHHDRLSRAEGIRSAENPACAQ